jgi:predicted small lipoprotein YifL
MNMKSIFAIAILAALTACGGGGNEKHPEVDRCAQQLQDLGVTTIEFLRSDLVAESGYDDAEGSFMMFSNGELRERSTYVQYGACRYDRAGNLLYVVDVNGKVITP